MKKSTNDAGMETASILYIMSSVTGGLTFILLLIMGSMLNISGRHSKSKLVRRIGNLYLSFCVLFMWIGMRGNEHLLPSSLLFEWGIAIKIYGQYAQIVVFLATWQIFLLHWRPQLRFIVDAIQKRLKRLSEEMNND